MPQFLKPCFIGVQSCCTNTVQLGPVGFEEPEELAMFGTPSCLETPTSMVTVEGYRDDSAKKQRMWDYASSYYLYHRQHAYPLKHAHIASKCMHICISITMDAI